LGRTALGYVGTLSDVVSDLASQLGAEILATLSKAQGERRLSRILRDIRARASQQLRAAGTNEEQLLRLVHAYNYVYFGEPYVELEVGPNESTRGQSSIQ
jgi:hypothetical protein